MIVLVDVDALVRATIVRGLEALGYRVREAESGLEALAIVGSEEPQLVIMDYVMPGLDGAETAREMARIAPGLPIIFSTGHAALRALRHAADGAPVLEKPFSLDELDALIKETLTEARKLRSASAG
jgi:CheY-like chemotaxis protein